MKDHFSLSKNGVIAYNYKSFNTNSPAVKNKKAIVLWSTDDETDVQ